MFENIFFLVFFVLYFLIKTVNIILRIDESTNKIATFFGCIGHF